MSTLAERIKRGEEAISQAKAQGKDTDSWELHLLRLRIEHIKESVFANRSMAIQIYSEVLGYELWFCSNQEMAEQIRRDDPGATVYTSDELQELISKNLTPEDLKRVHTVKSYFRKSRVIKTDDYEQ